MLHKYIGVWYNDTIGESDIIKIAAEDKQQARNAMVIHMNNINSTNGEKYTYDDIECIRDDYDRYINPEFESQAYKVKFNKNPKETLELYDDEEDDF